MSCVNRPGALGFSGLVWKCVLPGEQLLGRIVVRVSEDEELQNFLVVQQGAT